MVVPFYWILKSLLKKKNNKRMKENVTRIWWNIIKKKIFFCFWLYSRIRCKHIKFHIILAEMIYRYNNFVIDYCVGNTIFAHLWNIFLSSMNWIFVFRTVFFGRKLFHELFHFKHIFVDKIVINILYKFDFVFVSKYFDISFFLCHNVSFHYIFFRILCRILSRIAHIKFALFTLSLFSAGFFHLPIIQMNHTSTHKSKTL